MDAKAVGASNSTISGIDTIINFAKKNEKIENIENIKIKSLTYIKKKNIIGSSVIKKYGIPNYEDY